MSLCLIYRSEHIRQTVVFQSSPYLIRAGERALRLALPLFLFLHEQLPVHNAVRVADEGRGRELLGRAGHGQKLEAGFVRQAVATEALTRLYERLAVM